MQGEKTPLTGDPQPGDYLDLEFIDERVSGLIGGYDPTSTAPFGVELCGVTQTQSCAPND